MEDGTLILDHLELFQLKTINKSYTFYALQTFLSY